MFKHILLPTDGSQYSERAVFRGVELAPQVSARVTDEDRLQLRMTRRS